MFDEAHGLEDSLTAAWTERVDALELEILATACRPDRDCCGPSGCRWAPHSVRPGAR